MTKLKIIGTDPVCGCRTVEDDEGYRFRDRVCNLFDKDDKGLEGRDDWMYKDYNEKIKLKKKED